MAELNKENWPKTPGGTTDWEAVFEDAETGLIPLIAQAQSASALRECVIVVIQKLFTRKSDPPEVERFIAEITRLIPEETKTENLALVSEAVTGILRSIKEDRRKKAAEFERHKDLVPDRDKRDLGKKFGSAPIKTTLKILGGLVGTGLVGVAAVALYFYVFSDRKAPAPEKEIPRYVLVDQMKQAARGVGIHQHVFGGALNVGSISGNMVVVADNVPVDDCASAAWVFANRGNIAINGVMPKRISPRTLLRLCSAQPGAATLAWFPKEGWDKK